jgi:hypothetical protein
MVKLIPHVARVDQSRVDGMGLPMLNVSFRRSGFKDRVLTVDPEILATV